MESLGSGIGCLKGCFLQGIKIAGILAMLSDKIVAIIYIALCYPLVVLKGAEIKAA